MEKLLLLRLLLTKRYKTFVLFFSLLLFPNLSFSQITLNWNNEVWCSEFTEGRDKGTDIEQIKESDCLNVCEYSTVVYTLANLPTGTTVQWMVNGGTINSQTTPTTTASASVTWGSVGAGSIIITITTPTQTITRTLCIQKIPIPDAKFKVAGQSYFSGDVITVCQDQLLNFINLSEPANGTGLVSYFWDFGDGSPTSSAFEPSHSYAASGNYTVTLMVTNECNCYSKYHIDITVLHGGAIDISCPAIVCEGQTAMYSLPKEVAGKCNNFKWFVEGGHIVSESDGNVEVIWDNVDDSGFGYVTFDPSGCSLPCASPTTIKIPVIQANGHIQGETTVCAGTQNRYSLPQWATTDFQWEIVGNVNNNLGILYLTDQRNEVVIQPTGAQNTIILRCVYKNTLVNCGGIAELTINIEEAAIVQGNSVLCQNSTEVYTSNVPVNWVLGQGGNAIDTQNNTTSFSHTFLQAGNYTLTTNGTGICSSTIPITVVQTPSTPTTINGDNEICPNIPYTYSVTGNLNYIWEVTGGTIQGSNEGNEILVIFNQGESAYAVKVQTQTTSPIVCTSAQKILTVSPKTITADVTGSTSVCTNSLAQYQINGLDAGEYDTIEWYLSNPAIGSVTSGQGTETPTITWNNANTDTTVTLTALVKKCTVEQEFHITVTVRTIPVISITAPANTVCSGEELTFTIDGNGYAFVPDTTVFWDWGYGSFTQVSNGLTATHSFMNVTNNGGNMTFPVRAYITAPNGCMGTTNIATFNVTVKPAPTASLSIQSGGNIFCSADDINTVFAATAPDGALIEWYYQNGNDVISLSVPGNVLDVQSVYSNMGLGGFGIFYFVATLDGCSNKSNLQYISQICNPGDCTLAETPVLTNNSQRTGCNEIELSGHASVSPIDEYWWIYGPNGTETLPIGTSSYTATVPGMYQVVYRAVYECADGSLVVLNKREDILIPYIPDFAYAVSCTDNNQFTLNLTDLTAVYAGTENYGYIFEYQNNGTWHSISNNTATLPAGSYLVRITVYGDYDYQPQGNCQITKIVTFSGIPDMSVNLITPPNCHNTPIYFELLGIPSLNYSFLWDFGDGTTNTMVSPGRVYTTPGEKNVSVTVTNAFGCTRTFYADPITVPEPCFAGEIVSTPSGNLFCAGTSVTLSYQPGNDNEECDIATYEWLNQDFEVMNTDLNAESISITSSGGYRLRIKSQNECEYITPVYSVSFKPLPAVKIEGDNTFCTDTEVSFKANTAASIQQWTLTQNGTTLQTVTGGETVNFGILPAGNYTITVSVIKEDCVNAVSQEFSVVAPPQNLSITPTLINCDNYEWKLVATATGSNITYLWSNGMTGSSITVNAGGVYMVTAYNTSNGCSTSEQITLPKSPSSYIWIFPAGCYADCKSSEEHWLLGPLADLQGWAWNMNGNIDESGSGFTPSYPLYYDDNINNYSLTLANGGCKVTSETLSFTTNDCKECSLKNGLKDISFIQNPTDYCSFTVTLQLNNTGYPYNATLVDLAGNVIFDLPTFSVPVGTSTHTFTVILQSPFTGGMTEWELQGSYFDEKSNETITCTFKEKVYIPMCGSGTEKEKTTGKETDAKITADPDVQMYPNPAKANVTVRHNLQGNISVTLYDLTGRKIINQNANNASTTLNTSHLQAGIYVVVLSHKNKAVWQQKLIINK